MSKKFKFTENNYFKVPLDMVLNVQNRDFPLFIYLKRNDHLIMRYAKGEDVSKEEVESYKRLGLVCFWTPNEYKVNFVEFKNEKGLIEKSDIASVNKIIQEEIFIAKQKHVEAEEVFIAKKKHFEADEVFIQKEKRKIYIQEFDEKEAEQYVKDISNKLTKSVFEEDPSESAEHISDILESDTLSDKIKTEIVKTVSTQILGVLANIASDDKNGAKDGLDRVKQFSGAIIEEVSKVHKSGSIYDEIIKIHQLEASPPATVAAFAVMFSMCTGLYAKELLANIAFGALLHDIGFTKLNYKFLNKPVKNFSQEEQSLYEIHVERGVKILDENGIVLTPVVREIIEQHHELFDGSGYPKED